MNKRIIFTWIFFVILGLRAYAQPKLTLAQQQEDFTIFRTGMQEMHAGVFWFITPERYQAMCDSVYRSLTDQADTEQFYLKVRYCLAALGHGHSNVFMTNQEKGINYKMSCLPKSRKHLPLVLSYLGERLFVMQNCGRNPKITNGSEIVRINGKPVKELSREFCQYAFANGRNTTFKYQMLGTYFQFHYCLQMLYPADKYELEIIPYGAAKKVKVAVETELPQTMADNYQRQTGKAMDTWGPLLEYKLLDPATQLGYLKLETFIPWRVNRGEVTFSTILEKLFLQIKNDGVAHLIVDVRDNEGGDDSWQLTTSYFRAMAQDQNGGLPYIQSDKFSQMKYIEMTDDNREILQTFAQNPYAIVDKMPDGRFKMKPEFTEHDTKAKPLMPNAYAGKVYLIQNGLTFSAGFAFATTLKELVQQDGGFIKVIGEDHGDDLDAGVASSGGDLDLVLPNSKIKVGVPVRSGGSGKPYQIPARQAQFVDYKVIPTIKDKMNGVDTEVEFVKQLIKKSSK
jgi:hypothetical protein